MVYDPPLTAQKGRKLRHPWRGPYHIVEIVKYNNALLKSELTGEITRCHVNQMANLRPGIRENLLSPATSGVFSDTQNFVESMSGTRGKGYHKEYRVNFDSMARPTWIKKQDLPPILVSLYKESNLKRNQRDGAEEEQMLTQSSIGTASGILRASESGPEMERIVIHKRTRSVENGVSSEGPVPVGEKRRRVHFVQVVLAMQG